MKTKYNSALSPRRWLFMAFPPLAAILFALALVMPASAATITNITLPVSGVSELNPCNGEAIILSGELHLTIHVTLDNSGGYHADTHVIFHLTGTGDQGNTYVGNEVDNNPFNGKVGFEKTVTGTFSLISEGSAPNAMARILFHITVHPDGTVTALVDHATGECRG